MRTEEFLTYMFYRIKGEHLFKVNYDELFNMLEVILPKPTFFVDRGYER